MDITITQNIELYALVLGIFGVYFTLFKSPIHAWIDKIPDDPKNVWKRIENNGHENFAPYVKELALLASKIVAPIAFFSIALIVVLSPLGYSYLAEEILGVINYYITVPAIMVLIACVMQWLYIRGNKAKRK